MIELDTATTTREIHGAGHAALARRTSSATANLTLDLDLWNGDAKQINFEYGEGFRFIPFTKCFATWTAQPTEWVELYIWGDLGRICSSEPEVYVSPIVPT